MLYICCIVGIGISTDLSPWNRNPRSGTLIMPITVRYMLKHVDFQRRTGAPPPGNRSSQTCSVRSAVSTLALQFGVDLVEKPAEPDRLRADLLKIGIVSYQAVIAFFVVRLSHGFAAPDDRATGAELAQLSY